MSLISSLSNLINKEDFQTTFAKFTEKNGLPFAYGIGICFSDSTNKTIAVKWITMSISQHVETAALLMYHFGITFDNCSIGYYETSKIHEYFNLRQAIACENSFSSFFKDFDHLGILRTLPYRHSKLCFIFYKDEASLTEQQPQGIPDAHFRLAAISRLHYRPNTLCLDNLLDVLPTLVWNCSTSKHTQEGPMSVESWNDSWYAQSTSDVVIDKFPPLIWGAPIPPGVRMPNYLSARLGAYLSPGTVIMPYGFVNFNAGTLGKAMVEGTIAAGVTIGDGTHVGKGAGFLGTISGGNTVKISTGKNCLIGALAECGIPLGDNCIVSLGVSFTENTPVLNVKNNFVHKAKEYAHMSNITFRKNSITGQLEVLENK